MKLVTVVCGLILQDSRVLVARRKEEKAFGGSWEFPGGKVERGESPEESLVRELKEEFEIRTRVGSFLMEVDHAYESLNIRLKAFWVEYISGDFVLNDHDRIEWSTADQLMKYNWVAADISIARKVSEILG